MSRGVAVDSRRKSGARTSPKIDLCVTMMEMYTAIIIL